MALAKHVMCAVVAGIIAVSGCKKEEAGGSSGSGTTGTGATPAVTEVDLIGRWGGVRFEAPAGAGEIPASLTKDLKATVREFKADHTQTISGPPGTASGGYWTIDGSNVSYAYTPPGADKPITTKFKLEKGTLIDVGDPAMKVVWEKLKPAASGPASSGSTSAPQTR